MKSNIGFYGNIGSNSIYKANRIGFASSGLTTKANRVQFNYLKSGNSLSFKKENTSGNLLIVYAMGINNMGNNTIKDTNNNEWKPLGNVSVFPYNSSIFGYYCYNCKSGLTKISFTGPMKNESIYIAEYSGVSNTSNPFIKTDGNFGGNTPLLSELNLTNNSLILFCYYNNNKFDMVSELHNTNRVNIDMLGDNNFCYQSDNLNYSKKNNKFKIRFETNGNYNNAILCSAFKLNNK